MVHLGAIATILTGVTLRDRPDPMAGGSVRLLQLGDIDTSGSIALTHLISAEESEAFPERFFARAGDLIFRPRGAGIAVGIMPEHERDVVVVAPLILIRPDQSRVDPSYLTWVLRSRKAQQHYTLHARGTSVIGVGKRDLESLQIDLPNLETQRKVAAIVSLQQAEDALMNQLRIARRQLVDALLQGVVAERAPNSHRKGLSR